MTTAEARSEIAGGASEARGLSLTTRALLAVVAIVFAAVGAAGLLTHRLLERELEASLRAESVASASRLSRSLAPALRAGDDAGVRAAVDDAMASGRVAYVRVSDAGGRTMVSRVRENTSGAHDLAAGSTPEALGAPMAVRAGGRTLGYATRGALWGEGEPVRLLGYATVATSDPTVSRALAGLPRALLIAGGAVTVLAWPTAVLAARRMTRPTRLVADAAASLAEGETPDPLPECGPREMRQLARSFNGMATTIGEARDALQRSKADLEQAVRVRTNQLAAINQLLERQISDKNQFLRAVSHDLGAPLRNIAGMASLMLEKHSDSLPEEVVHRLERIAANVEIESGMIDDLLELSRLSERPERIETVDAERVVAELAESLGHDLRERRIELAVRKGLPRLRVDRSDLWTVLQNLVDNAIKYMGDVETRRIEIASEPTDSGAVLRISDTGPGIPDAELERVFRMFQRASTSKGQAGKGVGLSVVQAIVERWSGRIDISSREGEGTVFSIHLPAERLVDGSGAREAA